MDDVVDCSMMGVTSHTGLTADARSATCRDLCTTTVAYVWCTDGSAQAKTHSYPQGAIIHSQTHRRACMQQCTKYLSIAARSLSHSTSSLAPSKRVEAAASEMIEIETEK